MLKIAVLMTITLENSMNLSKLNLQMIVIERKSRDLMGELVG
jgi:hypothetical protein